MTRSRLSTFALAASTILGCAAGAQAQSFPVPDFSPQPVSPAPRGTEVERQPLPRGDTVATRQRPEYDPLGVPIGRFLLFPRLRLYESWNDNVFATENDTDSAFITNVVPTLALQSDWSQHALNFFAGANAALYSDHTNLDYTAYYLSTSGRLDIQRDSTLTGGGGYARRYELPGSPNFISGASEPTPYDAYDAYLRYLQGLGRFNATVDAAFNRLDYQSVNTFQGPNNSNAEDDRNTYSGGGRVGYQLFPEYEAFIRFSGNRVVYDQTGNADRSSTGYDVAVGTALDLGGVLFGEVSIGYLEQYYDSSDFNTLRGVDFDTRLIWNITTLTTMTAQVTRSVQQTNVVGSPGVLSTLGELRLDHELLRNLILGGSFSVINDDYQDNNREDYYYIGGLNARYLFNRNLAAVLGYNVVRRSSDDEENGTNDYTQNIIRIGLQSGL